MLRTPFVRSVRLRRTGASFDVRQDLGQDQPFDIEPSPDRTATAGPRVRWAMVAGLALLAAATSWVIAWSVSPWLVPPYLLLMTWLLFPSSIARPGDSTDQAGSESSDTLDRLRPLEDHGDDDEPGDLDSPSSEPGQPASKVGSAASGLTDEGPQGSSSKSSTAVKGRRGRSKTRKARPASEPLEANWVEVAPGKFVRVEAADTEGPAGPHALVREPFDPLEPSPPPPTTLETDAPSDFPIDVEAVEDQHETSPFDPLSQDDQAGPIEPAQAIDGVTPQAEGQLETSDFNPLADRVVVEIDDEARSQPLDSLRVEETEEVGPATADESASEEPESPGLEAAAAASTEVTPGLALDESSTASSRCEAIVSNPGIDVPLPESDASPSMGNLSKSVPDGSRWRPRYPRTRTLVRAGSALLSVGRGSPIGRVVRSQGPTRPPSDPRRPPRRGAGRPRQITRTLPPRSPPTSRYLAAAGGCSPVGHRFHWGKPLTTIPDVVR